MAYNFLSYKKGHLDWEKFLESIIPISEGIIEFFPISTYEEKQESCIGISIPFMSHKLNNTDIWEKIVRLINVCSSDFSLKIYDLYSGQYISDDNLENLKENILGK